MNKNETELDEVLEDKNENDYILYFAHSLYTEISVLKASNGNLIYSKHIISGYNKLSGGELKTIASHF